MPARFRPAQDDDNAQLQKVTGGEFVLLTTATDNENTMIEMHSRFIQMQKELQEWAQQQMYLYFPNQAVIQYKFTRIDQYEKHPYQP